MLQQGDLQLPQQRNIEIEKKLNDLRSALKLKKANTQPAQQYPQPGHLQQLIDTKINDLQKIQEQLSCFEKSKENKKQRHQLNSKKHKLENEILSLQQQLIKQTNNYLQQPPFNGVVAIDTPQGQQLIHMIQNQDPRIKVEPVPSRDGLFRITLDGKPIYELNNGQPIKRVHTKIEKKNDDSVWEYVLAGIIVLMAVLGCVLAFINLNKKVDEVKHPKEETIQTKEKPKAEEKPNTTEQRDNQSVEVKEKICVATTTHNTKNDKVYGNCDPKKTDVKGIELTDDAKQALDTVSNPHDAYTIKYADGKTQTAYGIGGDSKGQIFWTDENHKIYHADKDIITITNKHGQTLTDGAENIICNLTYDADKSGTVKWYYNSNTAIEHNSSTGNILDITYKNENSTWGSVGITQSNIGAKDAISEVAFSTLTKALGQNNIKNTFLSPFKVENNKLTVNDLSTEYTYNNNTCIGEYDNENGFVSNIGENNDLRQVITTENRLLASDSKLQYKDANGKMQTLQDNVFAYDVNNGKITIKYNYNAEKNSYSTKSYTLANYNNINISSDDINSKVSNTQLNLANNVQKYIDPNSRKTYVYADGLKAKTTGTYDGKNYQTNFTLGNTSTTLSNLTADDFRNNETLTNMYNNNDELYNYIRLNERYDATKFTNSPINNYNQLTSLYSINNGLGY